VERLVIIIGTEAQAPDFLSLDAGKSGEDQNRRLDLDTRSERSTAKPDISGKLRSSRIMS
jgi:hypothetical protein